MAKQKEKEEQKKKEKKKEIIKIDGKQYKKDYFLIEEYHPAIGRILIIEGMKFKILDDKMIGSERSGTFIAKLNERDQELMEDYDEALEELSEKLVKKIDIKRLIKEKIKDKRIQEIKTGLFILKAQEDGETVEEEHIKGCYNYRIHYKNQSFDFCDGLNTLRLEDELS